MNLNNVFPALKITLIAFIGIPWALGVILLMASWFGNGITTGAQTRVIMHMDELINQCEAKLSRNEYCKLTAVKMEENH
jgi:hypothetical protein